MHHVQDMRRMGGLRKYMPITYATMLIGTLALVGTPFFSGFYSKDTIIEAAGHHAHEAGNWIATYGYWAVLLGAFVTSFYSFRLRSEEHTSELQSLMRISYAVFCLKKKTTILV